MAIKKYDIFGTGSNIEGRIFKDYDEIKEVSDCCKKMGLKIVLTSGTFDLFHVGHSRYLEHAKEHGDILIVGVDSDEKVKKIKGPNRPIVLEDERMEILCHCRHVDLVFLKEADDPKWNLIKTLRPDVLITTQGTYKENEVEELRQYCKEIFIFEPQATTSTTAKIRRIMMVPSSQIKEKLQTVVKELTEFVDNFTGKGDE